MHLVHAPSLSAFVAASLSHRPSRCDEDGYTHSCHSLYLNQQFTEKKEIK